MPAPLTVGSLFSGIGGFDLGLERAGMTTRWFCEQGAFCQRVLAHHWPDVPCYPDVTALRASDVEPVDVLCGGFPCQDISLAGKGAGIDGARSGLWSEYARLIGELRPGYVVVENVSALLARGLGRVLGDLASLGYDAEWDCIPASAVGAPHRRDRLWLVAYPDDSGREGGWQDWTPEGTVAPFQPPRRRANRGGSASPPTELQDPDSCALQPWRVGGRATQGSGPEWWAAEPPLGRVAHGIPNRLDQLATLGNALVPQIAQWLGERILTWEAAHAA